MSTLRRRRRILFSLLPILGLLLLLQFSPNRSKQSPKTTKTPKWHIHHHLKVAHSACEGTLYPELCVSTISTIPNIATKSIPQIISATVNQTVAEVHSSASNCSSIRKKEKKILDPLQKRALDDCLELFSETVAELKSSLSDLSKTSTLKRYHDLQTLLSGAMTNQYTCLDGFAYSNGKVRKKIEKRLYRISRLVSNSLAMLKKLKIANISSTSKSKEAFPGYGKMVDGFPSWVSKKDRRLLQTSINATKYDLVVAKDGSGNFTTISDAVAAAPNSTTTRFVIYIKAGAYLENVEVVSKKTMLMFIGDGIEKTVVKASRNVVDGWTTFRSATVAVVGNGFIARDMSFENSAGPSKHQAVALRSGSDLSAFYRCSFVGYQDTLYVHSLRQFYRECDIYGTVDFVFGNAAVVLQNCNLYARKPNEEQKNIFTAQGREDPNQNTGISIINSKVAAAADLIPVKSSFKNYLGRPWKEYSRTVFIRCNLEDLIDPAGWLEWSGDFALSTLYYGEYKNVGAGSNTTKRVTWPGYRVITNYTEVSQFSVANFIDGNEWLPGTQISYTANIS
ncbi:pectinesterase [Telopea speciosissima]|uniref:pectinesterase n=1 Tax=Telopea speciosissima TaxID=54955 RepID=UPI001CC46457|nr:pectinesterase [Telopea speciosissima]